MFTPIYTITIVDGYETQVLSMADIIREVFTPTMNVSVKKDAGSVKLTFNGKYILRIADKELYSYLKGKKNSDYLEGGKKTRKRRCQKKLHMEGGGRTLQFVLFALFYFVLSNMVTYNISNKRNTQRIGDFDLDKATAPAEDLLNEVNLNANVNFVGENGLQLGDEFIQALIELPLGEQRAIVPSNSPPKFSKNETTLFAEVKLSKIGPTQNLVEATAKLDFPVRSTLIYPGSGHDGARGISMYGKYKREGKNITVTELYDVQGTKSDKRFPTATHDQRLARLYKNAAIEQISMMYKLNMIDNNKPNDTGYFNFLSAETPVIPTGYNPFVGRSDMFHQDGVAFVEPIDGESDENILLTRRVKGYQCNMCGKKMNPWNVHMTMTYEEGVMTANFRNKRDHPSIEGEEEITNINTSSELSQQQTFFMNQARGVQHSAVATGTHENRRLLLFFATENGDEWQPPEGTTLAPIYENV